MWLLFKSRQLHKTFELQNRQESTIKWVICKLHTPAHTEHNDDDSRDSSAVSSRGEYSDYTSNEKMYGS